MKVLSKNSVMEFVKKTAILWVMIILILILSVISPSFFRGQNLLNIIKQASITGVISVGMTFVLITGGIDLSVGSVMALSGTMAASVAVAEKNMPIALVILVGSKQIRMIKNLVLGLVIILNLIVKFVY